MNYFNVLFMLQDICIKFIQYILVYFNAIYIEEVDLSNLKYRLLLTLAYPKVSNQNSKFF